MQFLQPILIHVLLCLQIENIMHFVSDSNQILDQNISVGSGDYRESLNEKNPKFLILSYSTFGKTQI